MRLQYEDYSENIVFSQPRFLLYNRWMKKLEFLALSRPANIISSVIFAVLWSTFALRQLEAFQATGKYVFILFCISESLAAVFFLVRKLPKHVSLDPFDWFIAAGGTFTPFLFRPGGGVLWEGGEILVVLAVLIKITAVLSLNRSFGIVVAKRDIMTGGLYRIVRHPIYASYMISYSGFVLFNFTSFNLAFMGAALMFHNLRLIREEEYLSQDPAYQAYMKRVKWRLFPFIY